MKRYLVTLAVVLVLACAYSTWRANCRQGCEFEVVALGFPVFLTTPTSPDSGQPAEFSFLPLVLNVLWTAFVSVSFWAVVDTAGRWQDRRREPPSFP